jgi:hypothetical protein
MTLHTNVRNQLLTNLQAVNPNELAQLNDALRLLLVAIGCQVIEGYGSRSLLKKTAKKPIFIDLIHKKRR